MPQEAVPKQLGASASRLNELPVRFSPSCSPTTMSLPAGANLKLNPFTPTFTDDQLQGLKRKLHACGDLPPATYASKQRKYGIEHAWMEEALKYWEESFDW